MARWRFQTLDGSTEYIFKINPNAETSRVPTRGIEWDRSREGYSGRRASRAPFPWEFSGVVRDKQQFDAFVAWANRKEWIFITDDLGRQMTVRLLEFRPSQVAPARHLAPWRHTYTMKGLIKP